MLQAAGAEVIHLGHNRSVDEVVTTAIQEDVQGIAVSSYQGGHMEYFKYMYDLLHERGAGHIKIFGGGGGVIVNEEIEELEAYGITQIFSPEAGLSLGLEGMIESMMRACDFPVADLPVEAEPESESRDPRFIARRLSQAEMADVAVPVTVGGRSAPRGAPASHITGGRSEERRGGKEARAGAAAH